MSKPIICLDFDGTIHKYSRGWQNGVIYDDVVPGFFEWATGAKEHFKLTVFSSRSGYAGGRAAMKAWLEAEWKKWISGPAFPPFGAVTPEDFEFVSEKPPAAHLIDDRALRFNGDWNDPGLAPKLLLVLRPWNVAGSGTTGVNPFEPCDTCGDPGACLAAGRCHSIPRERR